MENTDDGMSTDKHPISCGEAGVDSSALREPASQIPDGTPENGKLNSVETSDLPEHGNQKKNISAPSEDLLSAFQAGLEQTMSLMAHMPEDVKNKALEALKVLIPKESNKLAESITSEQENRGPPSSTRISGSAKRKIPARAGLPKKLTSSSEGQTTTPETTATLTVTAYDIAPTQHDEERQEVKVKRKRGRPRKTPAPEPDEQLVLKEPGTDLPASCAEDEIPLPRRRGRPRKIHSVRVSVSDDEMEPGEIVNFKDDQESEQSAHTNADDSTDIQIRIKVEGPVIKEELPDDIGYIDDENDKDWTIKKPVRRAARNARRWHQKLFKQEAGDTSESEQVIPVKADVIRCENGDWKCSVCDRTSSVRQNIIVHLRIHTLERPYQCNDCERSFSVFTNLQRHCRDRHGEKPTHHCPIEECPYKAWSEKTLSEHMMKMHPEQKNIHKQVQCPDCDKMFANKHLLKVHSGLHEKERPFSCDQCSKTFSFKTNLQRHMWTHRERTELPYACQLCDNKYIEKKSLEAHVTRDHEGKKLGSPEKLIDCEYCDKKFASKGNYQNHLFVHTGLKPHNCKVCGKKFSMKSNMLRHQRQHTGARPWKCPECDKQFGEKRSLEVHRRLHLGIKPHKCNICGKCFTQLGTLQTHLVVHSKERNYLCGYCGKSFLRKSHYNFHMKKHNAAPTHSCSECDMKFYRKGDLTRHLMVHSNEKPYLCSLCPKRFTRLQYLKEHTNQHTGLRPHKCKQCGQAFADSSSLYKHQRIHNPARIGHTIIGIQPDNVRELPTGITLSMGDIHTPGGAGDGEPPMHLAPVNMEPQHDPSEDLEQATITEESLYGELGVSDADKSYVCKMCQVTLSSLNECMDHQKVHGQQEVSFLVTIKQPELEGQLIASVPQQTAQMNSIVTDPTLPNMIVPTESLAATGTPISLENMMQISTMVTAGDVNQQESVVLTQDQLARIAEGQIINTVAPGDSEDAPQVAMTMEQIASAMSDPSVNIHITHPGQSDQSQQPYLILLKNQS